MRPRLENIKIAVEGFKELKNDIDGVNDWFETSGIANEDEYDMILDVSEMGKMAVKLWNRRGNILVEESDKKDLIIQMVQLLVEAQSVDVDPIDWIELMSPVCSFKSTVVDATEVKYCVDWIKGCVKQKCDKMLIATTSENISFFEINNEVIELLDETGLVDDIYWCDIEPSIWAYKEDKLKVSIWYR